MILDKNILSNLIPLQLVLTFGNNKLLLNAYIPNFVGIYVKVNNQTRLKSKGFRLERYQFFSLPQGPGLTIVCGVEREGAIILRLD